MMNEFICYIRLSVESTIILARQMKKNQKAEKLGSKCLLSYVLEKKTSKNFTLI